MLRWPLWSFIKCLKSAYTVKYNGTTWCCVDQSTYTHICPFSLKNNFLTKHLITIVACNKIIVGIFSIYSLIFRIWIVIPCTLRQKDSFSLIYMAQVLWGVSVNNNHIHSSSEITFSWKNCLHRYSLCFINNNKNFCKITIHNFKPEDPEIRTL